MAEILGSVIRTGGGESGGWTTEISADGIRIQHREGGGHTTDDWGCPECDPIVSAGTYNFARRLDEAGILIHDEEDNA